MPAFWAFAAAAKHARPAELPELFERLLVGAHPQIYKPEVIGKATVELYWKMVRPYVQRMHALVARVTRRGNAASTRFARALPSFQQGATVYLVASLLNFDGGTRMIDGERCLLIGIDYLARARRSVGSIEALLHHELFHLHHGWNHSDFTNALWSEGLATYASRVLAPAASLPEVLGSEALARVGPAELARLAAEARRRLGSVKPDDERTFFTDREPDRAPGAIPTRAGYLVGFRAAELIGVALDDLVHRPLPIVASDLARTLLQMETTD